MKRLSEVYENTRSILLSELDAAVHVAITTDTWASLQTTSYRCVTVHYITKAWELKSCSRDILFSGCRQYS